MIPPTTFMKGHSYPSEGRCIHCTKSFAPNDLTDEHVIPLALNGALILRKAACESCRDRSNQVYEQPALNADFLVPRLLLELKRRKKSQKRPLPKVAFGDFVDGPGADFSTQLEVDQYGTGFALCVLPRAGKLTGIERTGNLTELRVGFYDFRKPLYGATKRQPFNHTATGLMVAKIALAFAAGTLGIDAFDGSEIRALLSGERTDLYNFVGSNPALGEKLTRRSFHSLYLRSQGGLLIVLVHLFASFEVPTYEVVVGKTLEGVKFAS